MTMRRVGLAIALILVVGACSGTAVPIPPATQGPASPNALLAPGSTAAPDPVPSGPTVVSTGRRAFHVFDAPDPGAATLVTVSATNDWGQRLALPVIGRAADVQGRSWLKVDLPLRPNGAWGWIRADGLKERPVDGRIVVDLSRHRLTRWSDGRIVARYQVAIGAPTLPTTEGTFFVWARVPYADPLGPYGVFALGLSGFSDVITDWPGGGRMAIHGTPNPGDIGHDVSHGCVRVYNADMRHLEDVPMGTPVVIRA